MNYRKLYMKHYGPIPVDEFGRTYDIHHIDGNRRNNDITNLKALTIQEHYDIHYSQGDWAACVRIAQKMKLNPEKISELVSNQQKERVSNGTHHWLGGESQRIRMRRLVSEGTHHFCDSEFQSKINKIRYKNGTGNFSSELSKKITRERMDNGTHHFIGKSNPVYKQLANGTHPLKNYKHQTKTCPVCQKTMLHGNYVRWNHGEQCSRGMNKS